MMCNSWEWRDRMAEASRKKNNSKRRRWVEEIIEPYRIQISRFPILLFKRRICKTSGDVYHSYSNVETLLKCLSSHSTLFRFDLCSKTLPRTREKSHIFTFPLNTRYNRRSSSSPVNSLTTHWRIWWYAVDSSYAWMHVKATQNLGGSITSPEAVAASHHIGVDGLPWGSISSVSVQNENIVSSVQSQVA